MILKKFMEKYIECPGILEALLGKGIAAPFIERSLDIGVFKRIVFIDISKEAGKRR